MAEKLLVRHAKSLANKRDFTAFGNVDSPLDPEKGIGQAKALTERFRELGIDPKRYGKLVLSSEYTRTQQTAELAGFEHVNTDEILNESVFGRDGLSPEAAVAKHVQEHWVPEETAERVQRFIDLVRSGALDYDIFFGHGLYFAGLMLNLEAEAVSMGEVFPHEFDEARGFIPYQATILKVDF